jgi:hypothetical protein
MAAQGNKADAEKTTAADGGLVNAAGLISVAGARLVVVRPDGTGSRPYTIARSWNAGGGVNIVNALAPPVVRAVSTIWRTSTTCLQLSERLYL